MRGGPGEGAPVDRRQRCWTTSLYYDATPGEALFRRHPCGLWGCSWCRERLEQQAIERYSPALPTTVERHHVAPDGLEAFSRKIKRHGGAKVHIPAGGGGYVVLVHGCAFGGEQVDAERALIEAIEARPGTCGRRIAASAGWHLLVQGAGEGAAVSAEEVDEPECEPGDEPGDRIDDGAEATPDLIYLGTTRRPLAEITRILDRQGLAHRITKRRDGELVMRSSFPPSDSWEFLVLTEELLSPRGPAA